MVAFGFRTPRSREARRVLGFDMAGAGFNWIEVSHEGDPEEDEQLAELARILGFAISYHCNTIDINLASLVPAIRRASLDVVATDLDRAARMNAGVVIVHAGSIGPFTPLQPSHPNYAENQAVIEYLTPRHRLAMTESLNALAARASILGMRLMVENMYQPWELVRTPADVNQLPDGVELCLDFGHARIAGIPPEQFPAQRVGHIHLHWNDGNYDAHDSLTPENAATYRAGVQSAIQAHPDLCLLLELPPRDASEYLMGITALRSLLMA